MTHEKSISEARINNKNLARRLRNFLLEPRAGWGDLNKKI